ncbi:MAG TPA: carboxypeptidase regulatory-like domain-containing protein [Candidatus Acidoferrales bacterium]|nr:carboxypeptidase regulatory-like domain-containing protein [Candidatus Acidoferrales bacterium]
MSARAHRATPRHPAPGRLHPRYWPAAAVFVLLATLAMPAGAPPAAGSQKTPRKREVVISGMVFTEKGFSLPGAAIRVNRAGERKVRWEAVSDRQGEFGLWVPQGGEYEVHVRAKGFEEQSQKVDGEKGTQEKLVFRMNPATPEKKP